MATILIVDDEAPMRDFLTMLFEGAGHNVVQAIHGRQALDLIERDRPDVVISDVMMPILDGVDFCRALKSRPATRSIPVILMSAAGTQLAREAAAEDFIAKPFSLDEMEAVVDRWLTTRHTPPDAGATTTFEA
jgi:CheY-like chemotaxis protein